jgi:hypothetical protein
VLRESLGGRLVGGVRQAQHPADCRWQETRSAQWSQLDQEDAIREGRADVVGELKREARLAGSAGPRQRQQPDVVTQQERPKRLQVLLASDEPILDDGQVRRRPWGVRALIFWNGLV